MFRGHRFRKSSYFFQFNMPFIHFVSGTASVAPAVPVLGQILGVPCSRMASPASLNALSVKSNPLQQIYRHGVFESERLPWSQRFCCRGVERLEHLSISAVY